MHFHTSSSRVTDSREQPPDLEIKLDLMPTDNGWRFSGFAYSNTQQAAAMAKALPGYRSGGPGDRVLDLAYFILDKDSARDLVAAARKAAAANPGVSVAFTTSCTRAIPHPPAPWPEEEKSAYLAAVTPLREAWANG